MIQYLSFTSFESILEGECVEDFESTLGSTRETPLILVESDVENLVLRLRSHFIVS